MIRKTMGKLLGCGCESQEVELQALRAELESLRHQLDELQGALRRASPPTAVGSFADAACAMAKGEAVTLGAPSEHASSENEPASEPESADARTLVIDLEDCIACGTCVEYCPAAFELGADGRAVIVDQRAPVDEVQAGMDACPTQCIRWEG